MLAHACTIRRRDGIMNIPEYFHNALLYSPQFQFINPAFEGMFRSILAAVTPALEQYGLAAVSWAVAEGKLIDMHRNRRYQWQPEEQVRALSARMKAYFDSQAYQQVLQQSVDTERFVLRWDVDIRQPMSGEIVYLTEFVEPAPLQTPVTQATVTQPTAVTATQATAAAVTAST
eukprot:TRINITY_DN1014_c0_g3_i3.p2 TRINITY_DN1014_c0_g3~~TRINITY_DN1014_c0_g3_i3.p2  ORF type:complete len:174 (-),score=60.42 TRINITY_DN1014_c0_g3_i3:377-898(-)